jgi:hypothetical protein
LIIARQSAIFWTLLAAGQAERASFEIDPRSNLRGLIRGTVQFADGSELHFREFVDVTRAEPKLMYAYHYQDAEKKLLLRYDNAMHRPPLPQVEHKHTKDTVGTSPIPTLAQVVDEILRIK